jgi:hypothetical protein
MMNRRTLVSLLVAPLIIVGAYLLWYNSSQQKLQRCVKAQSDHFISTSEGQELHRRGSDPPESLFILECNQLGIK